VKNIKLITTAKSAAITAVLLSFALLLAACAEGGGDAPLGVITLNLSGIAADSANARAAYPPGPAELAKIKYTVELQGASYIKVETKQGEHNVSIKAPAGQYRVTVTAYLDGVLYAVGFEAAVIEVGKPNSATITMRKGAVLNGKADFKTWLPAQPDNTKDKPYNVKMNNISDLGISDSLSLDDTLSHNTNKYVNFDFSGSTFTYISAGYFQECTNLTGIILPDTVKTIEAYVFTNCTNLTSVTFEGSITSTGFDAYAFGMPSDTYYTGDLRDKYLAAAGGAGTYTRPANGTIWTKQP